MLTFEECFQLNIAEPILGFVLDNPDIKTTIVLAPSVDDAHHTFCFPQPAFAKKLFRYVLAQRVASRVNCVMDAQRWAGRCAANGNRTLLIYHVVCTLVVGRYDDGDIDLVRDGRVMLLSNPASFKVNGVTVSLSTADVVADVLTEQISGKHRINRVERGPSVSTRSSHVQAVAWLVGWL